jgi:hypothetical protein
LIAMMMSGPVDDWIAEVMRGWMPFPSMTPDLFRQMGRLWLRAQQV